MKVEENNEKKLERDELFNKFKHILLENQNVSFETSRDILEFREQFNIFFKNRLSTFLREEMLDKEIELYLRDTKDYLFDNLIVKTLQNSHINNDIFKTLKWLNFDDKMIEQILLIKEREIFIVAGLTASGRTTLLEALGKNNIEAIKTFEYINNYSKVFKIHSSNDLKIFKNSNMKKELEGRIGLIYIKLINNKPIIETHFL